MECDAVIFDLDGTLLNTIDDIADAVNAALGAFDFPTFAVAQYKKFVGDGLRLLTKRVLPPDTEESLAEAFLHVVEDQYKKHWDKKTLMYAGIPEVLNLLAERKIPCAVHSNKPHEFTILTVARFLQQWRFACVCGARQEVPKKPDPLGALEIAAHIGARPDRILYVGDTDVDMRTAVSAGMFPVGVSWGFRDSEELRASGARAVIDHPAELMALLE
jgi:phosphoglycolate phosphatase